MADYVAKRNVQIGRLKFKAGQAIKGVSEEQLEHLNGRFVEVVKAAKKVGRPKNDDK